MSWDRGWGPPARRHDVEGGVVVTRPGQVSKPAAVALVRDAERESDPAILGRGRTYARAGQVVSLQVEHGQVTARIQGTRAKPYKVALRAITISGSERTDATCSCPYGCDFGWCKHAAALAYVAAHLLDTEPTFAARWAGIEPPADAPAEPPLPVPQDLLARLRRPAPQVDVAEMVAAAQDVLVAPHHAP